MLKHIPFDESLAGKVIAGCRLSYELAMLTFTDGTYTVIGVEHGYYDSSPGLEAGKPIKAMDADSYAVELGIYTQEEVDAARDACLAQSKLDSERAERQRYEMLKRRFEGGA